MSQVAFSTSYYASSSDYPGTGDVGHASFSGSTISATAGAITQYTENGSTVNLSGDTKTIHLQYGTRSLVLVGSTKWTKSGTTLVNDGCRYMIYDVAGNGAWTTAVYGPVAWSGTNLATQTSVDLNNVYKAVLATVGTTTYLYGIDYDAHAVFRIPLVVSANVGDAITQVSGSTINVRVQSASLTYCMGEDLLVASSDSTDYVYALFGNTSDYSTYAASNVVKYSMDLTVQATSSSVVKNAFSIQAYSDYLIAVGIGGSQQGGSWNPDSRIQKIAKSDLTVTDLYRAAASSSEAAEDQYDFRALAFSSNGNYAFILTAIYSDTSYTTVSWRLSQMDMATLMAGTGGLLSDESTLALIANGTAGGYLWALAYPAASGDVWFAKGNQLDVYSTSAQLATVNIDALSTLPTGAFLNSLTLYDTTTTTMMIGYTSPLFASKSEIALKKRQAFLKKIRK